jgi:oligogalacturonide lyase
VILLDFVAKMHPRQIYRIVSVALLVPFCVWAADAPPPTTQKSIPDEWLDPTTAHRVLRLSRLPGRSANLYFHQNVYTQGGDKMVFTNTPPAGRTRICAYDFKTNSIDIVAEPPADDFFGPAGLIVAPKSRQVFYRVGASVYTTDIDTHKTRKITDLPPDWVRGAGFTLNADETLLAGSYSERGNLNVDRSTSKGVRMEVTFAAHLPNYLYTVRTDTGEQKIIHHIDTWLGHVQFSPTDPALLMFCHEGPWHKLDRIWTIHTDGAGLKLMHERKQPMEIAGHEFWDPSGSKVWFDLQTPKGEQFFLASSDLEGHPRERFELERDEWSVHFNVTRDGKLFCGDGGDAKQVAKARDGKWIYLFTPQPDGTTIKSERLYSMADQDYSLEPNVRFSPDAKWVIFGGNMHGSPQVYAVEVAASGARQ